MSADDVAFRYRRRYGADIEISVEVGGCVMLDERTEYIVVPTRPLSATDRIALAEMGGEVLQVDVFLLNFVNYVGQATLLGVRLEVISTKLGIGGPSRLLQEISELAASLVFGWRAPTSIAATTDPTRQSAVPYHQLQFIRDAMLRRRQGSRLQDWLAHVARNPTRRFDSHRPLASADRVRRLDHRALVSIFARLDRLAVVPESNLLLEGNLLARALTFGHPPMRHFPSKIAAPQTRLSFDTPENKFVRHVVRECIAIVGKFAAHPKLHLSLRQDCASMMSVLGEAIAAPHLEEVGSMGALQAPSQALAKAEGYRDVFAFWNELTRHISLPPTSTETARMLEGRDIATLYEYWVFLKVLSETARLVSTISAHQPQLIRSDLDERIGYGCLVALGPDVSVEFNSSFSRSARRNRAYSTPLRPDVTLIIYGLRYVFDAKYRLDKLNVDEDDTDDAQTYTYKRADLYKMHTYRDAIADVRAAFVVFPGTEFVFFERSGSIYRALETIPLIGVVDGVGAIPLRPADLDPCFALRALLEQILKSQGITPRSLPR